MTNEAILDEQLDIWRRKLTEHKAALEQAGALAVAGDTAQAARLITDATTGAAIAQSAIEALEARREAAQASDLLAKADRLEAMAAEFDAQAAPIYAQVDALIDQAAQLGVTLVRRGTQRDANMRSRAGGYRLEAAMLRRKAQEVK